MGLLTFKGGIHPKDGKALAKDQPIKELLPLGELVYPLSQHIGAPAVPLVKKGDHVLKGQKIAEAGGFVSAPVYASVAGTVKAIEMRYNPAGSKVNCIVLENDGTYEEVEYTPITSLKELTKEEIIERISEAGVVGMGGAGFPTKVKLSPKEADKIEYIIANGAECEPYITADYRRMMECTKEIKRGDCRKIPYERESTGDEISAGCRASVDLCHDKACHSCGNVAGRCRMYSR